MKDTPNAPDVWRGLQNLVAKTLRRKIIQVPFDGGGPAYAEISDFHLAVLHEHDILRAQIFMDFVMFVGKS